MTEMDKTELLRIIEMGSRLTRKLPDYVFEKQRLRGSGQSNISTRRNEMRTKPLAECKCGRTLQYLGRKPKNYVCSECKGETK